MIWVMMNWWDKTCRFWEPLVQDAICISINKKYGVWLFLFVVVLGKMQYLYLEIEVEVETTGSN